MTLDFIKRVNMQTVLIIVLVIICVCAITQCNIKSNGVISASQEIKLYQAQKEDFTTTINKLGEKVNTQNTLIADRSKELEKALLANSELDKLNYQIRSTTAASMRSVLARYKPYVRVDSSFRKAAEQEKSDTNCVPVGQQFSDLDKWHSLYGTVKKSGVEIDSLDIRDSCIYNLGMKRNAGFKGYFQAWTPTIEVIHSNPQVNTKSLQNINLVDKPKWFEKNTTWGMVGVGVGIIATLFLTH